MHPPDPLPARGAGEWAPRRRLVKNPGVPAGGDCELLPVLLRVVQSQVAGAHDQHLHQQHSAQGQATLPLAQAQQRGADAAAKCGPCFGE